MISLNNRGFIADARTRQVHAKYFRAGPLQRLSVVCHITLAAAVAPYKFAAFFHRRPNPAVKRTNTGGAHLLASLTSGAPLFAPYLLR